MRNLNDFRTAPFNLGTWLSIGSPVIAELASHFPFAWLLIDLEHGNITESGLLDNFRAIRNEHTAKIVRLAGFDSTVISRVLDWGADGIMLPHVISADQAQACVEAMHYAPHGHRGFSSSVRRYRYGLDVQGQEGGGRPLLFAQIEDITGVMHADEIARVDGVDVLFVGPADLKLSLKHQKGETPISFEEALTNIINAAAKHGKKAGILIREQDQLEVMEKQGYTCIAIDSDLGVLRRAYAAIIALS